jgi:hypothetical protein
MAVDHRDFREYVRRLGFEFARRGMPEVEMLLIYFQALETDSVHELPDLHVFWTEDLTLEWMKTLQIPPFESAYEVRPFGASCAACERAKVLGPAVRRSATEVVFPGGARIRCLSCGGAWLELTDALG